MKICIDAGHGGKSSGAAGKYSLEKNINLDISLKLQAGLIKSGIQVVMTRSSDIYLDLQERCDIANRSRCDYFISIHCNSFNDPIASGTETYYYRGSGEGFRFATAVQKASVGYNQNKDRGVKTSEFYVIKYTNMPAVLLEVAFISNEAEEDMINDKNWQDGFTKAVATSICNHLGIPPNVEDLTYTVYQDDVAAGVYKAMEDAIRVVEELLAGMTSGRVKVIASNGMTVYERVKQDNFYESYNPITDFKRATAAQMESFVHRINPNAPYLAEKFLKIGEEENIRGDIAFAQSILETNYFRFTGNVKPAQNNFGGLGSTGPGVAGASFATPEEGIRAQIQHLKAYANTDPIETPLVDPRFNLVKRGIAPNFEDLNGKWAVPGDNYGQNIINIWRSILNEKVWEGMKLNEGPKVTEKANAAQQGKTIEEIEKTIEVLTGLLDRIKNNTNS